jgi:hypothetical protein
MNVEQLMTWELARETEVIGEHLLQYHISLHELISDRTQTFTLGGLCYFKTIINGGGAIGLISM